MTQTLTLSQTDDTALRNGATLQLRPDAGVLLIADADRADFLHRMTTNNINALRAGQSAVTVLTSPTARIVFVFTVVCRADDLLVLPAPGETAAVERYLRGQIFFMDKVKVRNVSADYARLRLMGDEAGATLAAVGLDLNVAADGAWQARDGLLAVKQMNYDLPGYELILPLAQQQAVLDDLTAAGATLLDDDVAYHALRIELGRPLPGRELTGDYNPLEAGLAWACSDNKGCYTGQEIIARQITYDKVTKTLVGLRSAAALTAGAELTVDGRSVGVVTSAAHSPTLDAPIALAIVKRPHNVPGSSLQIGDVTATVVALPFNE